jgi:hypothetical protein
MKYPSARHLMPKALKHKTGFHDGAREHHSAFKHPGVSEHKGGPEWAHGAGDDMHMSDNGMSFGDSNPDEATHMTGMHGHKNPRHEHIHRMLVRK